MPRRIRPLSKWITSTILLGLVLLFNIWIPPVHGFYLLLLQYLLTFLLLILTAHFLMCVHLTSLFEITKSHSDFYVLHLRPRFVAAAWALGRSPKRVALCITRDFIKIRPRKPTPLWGRMKGAHLNAESFKLEFLC